MSKKRNILVTEVEQIDQNGVITKHESTRVFKLDGPSNFLMFFTENMAILKSLDGMESRVLFLLLEGYVTYKNTLDISPNLRRKLEKDCNIHRVTLSRAITGLVEKQVLIKVPDESTGYYLNPYVFGKGNWADIVKLRQNLQLEFDFKKNEATAKITAVAITKDGQEMLDNPNDFELKQVEVSQNENSSDTSLFVSEKALPVKTDYTLDKELELQKERNRELELIIKKNEVELELLKIKGGQG